MRRDEMAKPYPPSNQLFQADACRVEPISPSAAAWSGWSCGPCMRADQTIDCKAPSPHHSAGRSLILASLPAFCLAPPPPPPLPS